MEPVPTTPKVVVALIERNGKFVIIERRVPLRGKNEQTGKLWTLQWVWPGGLPKGEETLEEALIREVREEVGMDVEIVVRIGERKHPDTKVPVVYFGCRLKREDQEPAIGEPKEIKSVEWVGAQDNIDRFELFGLDIFPEAREYVLGFAEGGGEPSVLTGNGNRER